jgi:predicted glycosyl hydrolase (DUF1957 family)
MPSARRTARPRAPNLPPELAELPDAKPEAAATAGAQRLPTADVIVAVPRDPGSVFVFWSLTARGVRRVRPDLGERTATPMVRLYVFGRGTPTPEVIDLADDRWIGERSIPLERPGTRVVAAVGLSDGDTFTHVARSAPVRLPGASAAGPAGPVELEPVRPDVSDAPALGIVLRLHAPRARGGIEQIRTVRALAETVVPIVERLDRLRRGGPTVRVTLAITPDLLAASADPAVLAAFDAWMHARIAAIDTEVETMESTPAMLERARSERGRLAQLLDFFARTIDRDIPSALRALEADGVVELATAAFGATPLSTLAGDEGALDEQLTVATARHRSAFGSDPHGIWLAGHGYTPEIATALAAAGLRWAVVDAEALRAAESPPAWQGMDVARDPDTGVVLVAARPGPLGAHALPEGAHRRAADPHGVFASAASPTAYDPARGREAAEAAATRAELEGVAAVAGLREAAGRAALCVWAADAGSLGASWHEGPIFLERLLHLWARDPRACGMRSISGWLGDDVGLQRVRLAAVPASTPLPDWAHRHLHRISAGIAAARAAGRTEAADVARDALLDAQDAEPFAPEGDVSAAIETLRAALARAEAALDVASAV